MFALISPAKKMNFEPAQATLPYTQPVFLEETKQLAAVAQKLSAQDLMRLMKISESLASLNHARFQAFAPPFDLDNAKQAALAFSGDTYVGLEAWTLTEEDFDYAQTHLGILSGLYGLLRPLDLIQPYRLEMGTKMHNPAGEDLYCFWKDHLAPAIDQRAHTATSGHDPAVINLASNEYFKAVDKKQLKSRLITPIFKELKDGQTRTIGLFAKRARGAMARYIVEQRLSSLEDLKTFSSDGYHFQKDLSSDAEWIFTRPMPEKSTS